MDKKAKAPIPPKPWPELRPEEIDKRARLYTTEPMYVKGTIDPNLKK